MCAKPDHSVKGKPVVRRDAKLRRSEEGRIPPEEPTELPRESPWSRRKVIQPEEGLLLAAEAPRAQLDHPVTAYFGEFDLVTYVDPDYLTRAAVCSVPSTERTTMAHERRLELAASRLPLRRRDLRTTIRRRTRTFTDPTRAPRFALAHLLPLQADRRSNRVGPLRRVDFRVKEPR